MSWITLREIAHARAGDKGNTLNIALIAYHPEDYPLLEKEVTPERVAAHFRGLIEGAVTRYALPNLGALNFVLHQALAGGVTRSLRIDAHGKALSFALLTLKIKR